MLSFVVATVLAVPAVTLSTPQARAEEARPDPDRVRRRLMWGAVALSGAGLLGGVYAFSRYQRGIDNFNRFQVTGDQVPGQLPDGRCSVNAPNRGGPACAELLDDADRAHTAFQVSLAVAGAAATTAVFLKLLEPDAPKRAPAPESWALTCTPMPGAGGTCTLRF